MKDKKDKAKKPSFFSDFKAFISRGNIMQLAVAVIIGAAFGKIVSSLVSDIFMPLMLLALGGLSLSDLSIVLSKATYDELGNVIKEANILHYGAFIQTIIDFIVIAFCIFIIVRLAAKTHKKVAALTGKKQDNEPEAPVNPPPPTQEELLTQIRDILQKSISEKTERE